MLCLKASLSGAQSHKNHEFLNVISTHAFHVLKLRIEMNVYDCTQLLHGEFLSCKTENHIRPAATVAAAIPNSSQYASLRHQDHALKGS